MEKHLIYKHTFPNDKVYIGQCTGDTIEEAMKRWRKGLGYFNQPVYRAIKKYGWDNIKHEILEIVNSQDEADNVEVYYIALYDSTNTSKGYNVEKGGCGHNMGKDCYSKEYVHNACKKWGEKNREHVREKSKEHYEKHKDTEEYKMKLKERNKNYYEKHKNDPEYKEYKAKQMHAYYERKKRIECLNTKSNVQ